MEYYVITSDFIEKANSDDFCHVLCILCNKENSNGKLAIDMNGSIWKYYSAVSIKDNALKDIYNYWLDRMSKTSEKLIPVDINNCHIPDIPEIDIFIRIVCSIQSKNKNIVVKEICICPYNSNEMMSLFSNNNVEIIDASEAAKKLNECNNTSIDIKGAILIHNNLVGKNNKK